MNKSGILSLAGFAYQIKVFVYYVSKLEENYTIGFEIYDDVSVLNLDAETKEVEKHLQEYNELLKTPSGIKALQIKHTKLYEKDYENVLFNWIILCASNINIDEFILIADKSYGNTGNVFPADLKLFYDKIVSAEKNSSALISQVKKIINTDYERLRIICETINSKYKFFEIDDIDDLVFNAYKSIFNHGGIKDVVYTLRIQELSSKLEHEILESVYKGRGYTCEYKTFKSIVEDINLHIRDDLYLPSYSDFKKNSSININSISILKSRQYIQLTKCKISESVIKEQLIFEEYYNNYKFRCLENIRLNIIDDLENTTHYNFETTKNFLQRCGSDSPYLRLYHTQKEANSYAPNEQIRNGSAIHLTKQDTDPSLLISWEDELDDE